MCYKKLISKIALVAIIFVLAGCGSGLTSIETATATLVPPTETATFTPSPIPTNTPTFTPTPMGGRNGLLLSFNGATLWDMSSGSGIWREDLDLIYTYDMVSKKTKLLFEGYSCIGVSPDGQKIAMRKTENDITNLYVANLAKPEEIVLLYEDVVNTNRWSDYSYWFPGTEWIGFIAKKDGIPQVFIIHPDGSNLTQVTNSTIGAVGLQPVFRDGIFWDEGTEKLIQKNKWTKLDGTEVTIPNLLAVSPSGKYVMNVARSRNPDCLFCEYDLVDPATGETKEITLTKPKPDNDFPQVQPLSDGQWLVYWYYKNKNGESDTGEYWIYSTDGKPLLSFADLPHDHGPIPEERYNVDAYNIIHKNGVWLPVMPLSPDGNLLLITHEVFTYEKHSGQLYGILRNVSYYILNLSTFEIQTVPGLHFDRNSILGPNQGFYWVELP